MARVAVRMHACHHRSTDSRRRGSCCRFLRFLRFSAVYMVTSPCSRYETSKVAASLATSVTTLPCRFMSSSLSVSRCMYESIAALPRPMLSFVPRRNRFQCAFGAVGSRTPGIVRLVARAVPAAAAATRALRRFRL